MAEVQSPTDSSMGAQMVSSTVHDKLGENMALSQLSALPDLPTENVDEYRVQQLHYSMHLGSSMLNYTPATGQLKNPDPQQANARFESTKRKIFVNKEVLGRLVSVAEELNKAQGQIEVRKLLKREHKRKLSDGNWQESEQPQEADPAVMTELMNGMEVEGGQANNDDGAPGDGKARGNRGAKRTQTMYKGFAQQVRYPAVLASVAPKDRWGYFRAMQRLTPAANGGRPGHIAFGSAALPPMTPSQQLPQQQRQRVRVAGSEAVKAAKALIQDAEREAAEVAMAEASAVMAAEESVSEARAIPDLQATVQAVMQAEQIREARRAAARQVAEDEGLPVETWWDIMQKRKKVVYFKKLLAEMSGRMDMLRLHRAAKTIQQAWRRHRRARTRNASEEIALLQKELAHRKAMEVALRAAAEAAIRDQQERARKRALRLAARMALPNLIHSLHRSDSKSSPKGTATSPGNGNATFSRAASAKNQGWEQSLRGSMASRSASRAVSRAPSQRHLAVSAEAEAEAESGSRPEQDPATYQADQINLWSKIQALIGTDWDVDGDEDDSLSGSEDESSSSEGGEPEDDEGERARRLRLRRERKAARRARKGAADGEAASAAREGEKKRRRRRPRRREGDGAEGLAAGGFPVSKATMLARVVKQAVAAAKAMQLEDDKKQHRRHRKGGAGGSPRHKRTDPTMTMRMLSAAAAALNMTVEAYVAMRNRKMGVTAVEPWQPPPFPMVLEADGQQVAIEEEDLRAMEEEARQELLEKAAFNFVAAATAAAEAAAPSRTGSSSTMVSSSAVGPTSSVGASFSTQGAADSTLPQHAAAWAGAAAAALGADAAAPPGLPPLVITDGMSPEEAAAAFAAAAAPSLTVSEDDVWAMVKEKLRLRMAAKAALQGHGLGSGQVLSLSDAVEAESGAAGISDAADGDDSEEEEEEEEEEEGDGGQRRGRRKQGGGGGTAAAGRRRRRRARPSASSYETASNSGYDTMSEDEIKRTGHHTMLKIQRQKERARGRLQGYYSRRRLAKKAAAAAAAAALRAERAAARAERREALARLRRPRFSGPAWRPGGGATGKKSAAAWATAVVEQQQQPAARAVGADGSPQRLYVPPPAPRWWLRQLQRRRRGRSPYGAPGGVEDDDGRGGDGADGDDGRPHRKRRPEIVRLGPYHMSPGGPSLLYREPVQRVHRGRAQEKPSVRAAAWSKGAEMPGAVFTQYGWVKPHASSSLGAGELSIGEALSLQLEALGDPALMPALEAYCRHIGVPRDVTRTTASSSLPSVNKPLHPGHGAPALRIQPLLIPGAEAAAAASHGPRSPGSNHPLYGSSFSPSGGPVVAPAPGFLISHAPMVPHPPGNHPPLTRGSRAPPTRHSSAGAAGEVDGPAQAIQRARSHGEGTASAGANGARGRSAAPDGAAGGLQGLVGSGMGSTFSRSDAGSRAGTPGSGGGGSSGGGAAVAWPAAAEGAVGGGDASAVDGEGDVAPALPGGPFQVAVAVLRSRSVKPGVAQRVFPLGRARVFDPEEDISLLQAAAQEGPRSFPLDDLGISSASSSCDEYDDEYGNHEGRADGDGDDDATDWATASEEGYGVGDGAEEGVGRDGAAAGSATARGSRSSRSHGHGRSRDAPPSRERPGRSREGPEAPGDLALEPSSSAYGLRGGGSSKGARRWGVTEGEGVGTTLAAAAAALEVERGGAGGSGEEADVEPLDDDEGVRQFELLYDMTRWAAAPPPTPMGYRAEDDHIAVIIRRSKAAKQRDLQEERLKWRERILGPYSRTLGNAYERVQFRRRQFRAMAAVAAAQNPTARLLRTINFQTHVTGRHFAASTTEAATRTPAEQQHAVTVGATAGGGFRRPRRGASGGAAAAVAAVAEGARFGPQGEIWIAGSGAGGGRLQMRVRPGGGCTSGFGNSYYWRQPVRLASLIRIRPAGCAEIAHAADRDPSAAAAPGPPPLSPGRSNMDLVSGTAAGAASSPRAAAAAVVPYGAAPLPLALLPAPPPEVTEMATTALKILTELGAEIGLMEDRLHLLQMKAERERQLEDETTAADAGGGGSGGAADGRHPTARLNGQTPLTALQPASRPGAHAVQRLHQQTPPQSNYPQHKPAQLPHQVESGHHHPNPQSQQPLPQQQTQYGAQQHPAGGTLIYRMHYLTLHQHHPPAVQQQQQVPRNRLAHPTRLVFQPLEPPTGIQGISVQRLSSQTPPHYTPGTTVPGTPASSTNLTYGSSTGTHGSSPPTTALRSPSRVRHPSGGMPHSTSSMGHGHRSPRIAASPAQPSRAMSAARALASDISQVDVAAPGSGSLQSHSEPLARLPAAIGLGADAELRKVPSFGPFSSQNGRGSSPDPQYMQYMVVQDAFCSDPAAGGPFLTDVPTAAGAVAPSGTPAQTAPVRKASPRGALVPTPHHHHHQGTNGVNGVSPAQGRPASLSGNTTALDVVSGTTATATAVAAAAAATATGTTGAGGGRTTASRPATAANEAKDGDGDTPAAEGRAPAAAARATHSPGGRNGTQPYLRTASPTGTSLPSIAATTAAAASGGAGSPAMSTASQPSLEGQPSSGRLGLVHSLTSGAATAGRDGTAASYQRAAQRQVSGGRDGGAPSSPLAAWGTSSSSLPDIMQTASPRMGTTSSYGTRTSPSYTASAAGGASARPGTRSPPPHSCSLRTYPRMELGLGPGGSPARRRRGSASGPSLQYYTVSNGIQGPTYDVPYDVSSVGVSVDSLLLNMALFGGAAGGGAASSGGGVSRCGTGSFGSMPDRVMSYMAAMQKSTVAAVGAARTTLGPEVSTTTFVPEMVSGGVGGSGGGGGAGRFGRVRRLSIGPSTGAPTSGGSAAAVGL